MLLRFIREKGSGGFLIYESAIQRSPKSTCKGKFKIIGTTGVG